MEWGSGTGEHHTWVRRRARGKGGREGWGGRKEWVEAQGQDQCKRCALHLRAEGCQNSWLKQTTSECSALILGGDVRYWPQRKKLGYSRSFQTWVQTTFLIDNLRVHFFNLCCMSFSSFLFSSFLDPLLSSSFSFISPFPLFLPPFLPPTLPPSPSPSSFLLPPLQHLVIMRYVLGPLLSTQEKFITMGKYQKGQKFFRCVKSFFSNLPHPVYFMHLRRVIKKVISI